MSFFAYAVLKNKCLKGLSHLDVEGVVWFSSAYGGTPESQNATKKPHKMGKTAEFFGGFLHLKMQNYIIKLYFVFAFEGGFCSTLNESAPILLHFCSADGRRGALFRIEG